MSPFTIFFLVVTFLYIIYYAVIITIDMNAKPKSEADNSETLDTEGMVAGEIESDDNSDNDEDDSTSAPATDEPLPYSGGNDENQESNQQSDEPDETSSTTVPEPEDDNPYGLTDEDPSPSNTPAMEPSATAEAIAAVGATPETNEPSESPEPPSVQEQAKQQEQKEPDVQVVEPTHENGGLAEDINNSNETIEAESLTPCKPNMLAANVFDIAKINRSFYGTEQPPESTLSEKQPMQNNEESVIMDKI